MRYKIIQPIAAITICALALNWQSPGPKLRSTEGRFHFPIQNCPLTLGTLSGICWGHFPVQNHKRHKCVLRQRSFTERGGVTPEEAYLASNFYTFETYMEDALYDNTWGAYGSGKLKLGHDFGTFPIALSPVYSQMVAERIFRMWRGMRAYGSIGEDELFYIIEFGAGTGIVARDVLEYVRQKAGEDAEWGLFCARLRYVIGEYSAAFANIQRRTCVLALADPNGKLTILTSDARDMREIKDRLGRVKGVVFSNELLDAMPANVASVKSDGAVSVGVFVPVLRDIGMPDINLEGNKFHEVPDTRLFPDLDKSLKKNGTSIDELRRKSDAHKKALPQLRASLKENELVLDRETFGIFQRIFSGPGMRIYRELYPQLMAFHEVTVPLAAVETAQGYIADNRGEIEACRHGEGGIFAGSQGWLDFEREAAGLLEKGYVFTIDDGGATFEYIGPLSSHDAAPVSSYHHRLGKQRVPFLHPGDVDIFVGVDFSAAAREGLRHGLKPVFFGGLRALENGIPLKMDSPASRAKIVRQFAMTAIEFNLDPDFLAERGMRGKDIELYTAAALEYLETGKVPNITGRLDLWRSLNELIAHAQAEAEVRYPWWLNNFKTAHRILIQQVEGTDPSFVFDNATMPLFYSEIAPAQAVLAEETDPSRAGAIADMALFSIRERADIVSRGGLVKVICEAVSPRARSILMRPGILAVFLGVKPAYFGDMEEAIPQRLDINGLFEEISERVPQAFSHLGLMFSSKQQFIVSISLLKSRLFSSGNALAEQGILSPDEAGPAKFFAKSQIGDLDTDIQGMNVWMAPKMPRLPLPPIRDRFWSQFDPALLVVDC